MHNDDSRHDSPPATGLANPGVIDVFGLDRKADEVLLVMREDRPWDGSETRLYELQEKFNAYVSFLLDGEMLAAHPELSRRKARIELHCVTLPDEQTLALLEMIHEQLALQEIGMEVVVAEQDGCGAGCTCHSS